MTTLMEKLTHFTFTTYVRMLQGSMNSNSLAEVTQTNAHSITNGSIADLFLGNHLIDMYVKCGSVEDAGYVFDKMR